MSTVTMGKDEFKAPKVRATLRRNGLDLVRDPKYIWCPVYHITLKGGEAKHVSALLSDIKLLSERDKWDVTSVPHVKRGRRTRRWKGCWRCVRVVLKQKQHLRQQERARSLSLRSLFLGD
jgi:hypothetical protein